MIYDTNYVSAIVISYPPDSVPAITIYGITNKDTEIQRLNHLHKDTVYIQPDWNLNSCLPHPIVHNLSNVSKRSLSGNQ